jgi:hypothetical protein
MRNLAGDKHCDSSIRDELEAAGVEIVEGERSKHEVAASLTGRLGEFTFRRAWYYWEVMGPLPVSVAEELYADTIGKKDVRVAGHCGCPPPEFPWAQYFDADGKELRPKDSDDFRKLEAIRTGEYKPSGMMKGIYEDIEAKCHFVDDLKAVAARAIVPGYHIDSLPGLILFCDAVRKHVLAPGGNKP